MWERKHEKSTRKKSRVVLVTWDILKRNKQNDYVWKRETERDCVFVDKEKDRDCVVFSEKDRDKVGERLCDRD